jgi:hypothetical protein
MNKIGMIVGFLMCILIVSTTAVSAAAPMDGEKKDGPCSVEDESSSCTSDCGVEDEASYQDSTSYLMYFGM